MGYFHTERAARVVRGKGEFAHRFGGLPAHKVTGDVEPGLSIHCLYLFDTADEALPRVLPERRWLPLYYPLFNNACDFAYQVVSDVEIRVHLVSDSAVPDFPYEDYPRVIPESPVRLELLSYEEQKSLVYYFMAEEFAHSDHAVSAADRRLVQAIEYPFPQLGGIQWMVQGVPDQTCPNLHCEDAGAYHDVFAVVWNNPVEDFTIWGEGMDDSQIIFQICQECQTIHVCNRCG